MSAYTAALVVGIVTGAVYALTATGLTLTYVTSGIFNISHGATGALGAYTYFELRSRRGLPAWLSLVLVIFVVSPVYGLVLEVIARRLAKTTVAYKVVAVIGLQLAIVGFLIAHYGVTPIPFPGFLPTSGFAVAGIVVGYDQLATLCIALLAVAGLVAFFRYSIVGTQMRAVVDDPDLLALAGTNTRQVRRIAWITGSMFATLSGILIAPTSGLDALFLSLLVLQAFGAAAVGLFRSLPLTLAGGLLIGIGQGLLTQAVAGHPSLSSLPGAIPFLVLFGVLLLVPKQRLSEPGAVRRLEPPTEVLPAGARRALGAALALLAVLVPDLVGARLPLYANAAAFVILFASLNLLVRTSGQISLCHAAFAAIGGTTFYHLQHAGVPWALALFGTGLVAVPVGALVAIPALRLSGLYLALATLGFGVLVQQLFYTTHFMFGPLNNRPIARPAWFTSDRAFYYLLLAFAIGACVLVGLVNKGRLGRLLQAMADSPTALRTHGLAISVTKLIVFCLSAWMAAIAGALLGAQGASTSSQAFFPIASLQWLAVLVISGRGKQSASIIAALLLTLPAGYVSDASVTVYFLPAFGILALFAVLATSRPAGSGTSATRVEVLGTTKAALRQRRPTRATLPAAG